jgi:hypothetical protein
MNGGFSWILNTGQMNQIQKWISSNQLDSEQRYRINNILVKAYHNHAHRQAYKFKYKHKYKCRNLHINDLKSVSEIALIKASQKYNGKSSFYFYSGLHIHYELLNALTNHNKISQISVKKLKNGFSNTRQNFNTATFYHLQNKLNVIYESPLSNQFINMYKHTDDDNQLWYSVYSSIDEPLMKKIFLLKYDMDFKKIRTDKQISNIIGYSVGYIRFKLRHMKKMIAGKISDFSTFACYR